MENVTDPLWVESTGHRWIPHKGPVTWALMLAWTNYWINRRVAGDLNVMTLVGCHCNEATRFLRRWCAHASIIDLISNNIRFILFLWQLPSYLIKVSWPQCRSLQCKDLQENFSVHQQILPSITCNCKRVCHFGVGGLIEWSLHGYCPWRWQRMVRFCMLMMTSWHGRAFNISGPLSGESSWGHRWLP